MGTARDQALKTFDEIFEELDGLLAAARRGATPRQGQTLNLVRAAIVRLDVIVRPLLETAPDVEDLERGGGV